MIYAPHTLYVRRAGIDRDEYNRPIVTSDELSFVCKCRMDDSDDVELVSENGKVFRPKYKIVCPRDIQVNSGDCVRVYMGSVVRGEGVVIKKAKLNFLNYSTLWI